MAADADVTRSTTYKGKPRPEPVWLMRYRLPSGKDSRKVLGKVWIKKGRPAAGYLTEAEALMHAQAFIAQHGADTADARRTVRVALDAFLTHCAQERGLARIHPQRLPQDR